jgi:hypothetical protein
LKIVQRVMHINVVSPRSLDIIFKMIGFSISKRVSVAAYCLFTFYLSVIILRININNI